MAAEKTFENKVKKYIEDNGGWQVKFFANRMTKKGIPDILACVNGYFLAVETKADNGKPSDLQKYHIRKIIEAGGVGIILYPQDWEFFKILVRNMKETNKKDIDWMMSLINGRSL